MFKIHYTIIKSNPYFNKSYTFWSLNATDYQKELKRLQKQPTKYQITSTEEPAA